MPARAIVVAVFINALWGGNPIAAKFGLAVFPPFWSAFIRFVLGVAVVTLWARHQGLRIWPLREEWLPLIWIAAMFTVQIALMNIGIDNTSGVMASVLIATNPLFAALFAHWLIAGDRLVPLRIAGLLIAFAGVCLTLIRPASVAEVSFSNSTLLSFGNWISLFSAGLLGLRLVISANVLHRIEPVRIAIWQMLLSLPVYAAGGFWLETIRWHNFNFSVVAGLVYQGVVVAGLGFTVSFWLMRHYRPSIMMAFNFVSPVVGVLLAWALLGEQVAASVIWGVVLVVAGLALIAYRSDKSVV